jgi:hypothetical protein
MKILKVLIACEESQRVCTEFRKLGHEAYSADIQEPSGGHPEWHIKGDVLEVLNPKDHLGDFEAPDQYISFKTMDGTEHNVEKWDCIIAFPPCTYLTMVATRHHSLRFTPLNKINRRTLDRIEGMEFFMRFANADCKHIAIENRSYFLCSHSGIQSAVGLLSERLFCTFAYAVSFLFAFSFANLVFCH